MVVALFAPSAVTLVVSVAGTDSEICTRRQTTRPKWGKGSQRKFHQEWQLYGRTSIGFYLWLSTALWIGGPQTWL